MITVMMSNFHGKVSYVTLRKNAVHREHHTQPYQHAQTTVLLSLCLDLLIHPKSIFLYCKHQNWK